MIYPYASGDLLDERNTYAYTPYEGPAFLDAWRRSRARVRATLPAPADPPSDEASDWRSSDVVDCAKLFDAVRSRPTEAAMDWFDRVVRRFEVWKRVWPRLTQDGRAELREDFRHVDLYVRFAEALEAAYQSTGSLVYLNAFLKCLDTCCSLADQIEMKARLSRLLDLEAEHVRALEARQ